MTALETLRALEAHYRRHETDCWHEQYGRCSPRCDYEPETADDIAAVLEDLEAMRSIVSTFASACFVDTHGNVYEADFGDLSAAHRAYREIT